MEIQKILDSYKDEPLGIYNLQELKNYLDAFDNKCFIFNEVTLPIEYYSKFLLKYNKMNNLQNIILNDVNMQDISLLRSVSTKSKNLSGKFQYSDIRDFLPMFNNLEITDNKLEISESEYRRIIINQNIIFKNILITTY